MEELIDDILHQMQRKLGSAQLKELRRVLVGTLSNRSNKEREERRHGTSWGGVPRCKGDGGALAKDPSVKRRARAGEGNAAPRRNCI